MSYRDDWLTLMANRWSLITLLFRPRSGGPVQPLPDMHIRIVLFAIAVVISTPTPAEEATHPLDGLTANEFIRVRLALEKAGTLGRETRLPLISLIEPSKNAVRNWRAGQPFPRRARAIVRRGSTTEEHEIDLSAQRVERSESVVGESLVLTDSYGQANRIILSDDGALEALRRRGLNPNDVFCVPMTSSSEPPPAPGRRIMNVPCFARPIGSNQYSRPISGLVFRVDFDTERLLETLDFALPPIANSEHGFLPDEVHRRVGPTLTPPPSAPSAPAGGSPSVRVNQSLVQWERWRFHFRVNKRAGTVLSLIDVKDQDRWRPVIYQIHLAEVFVPYMDASQGWHWRSFMDAGEFGFGATLSPLTRGSDCPADATFLPATVSDDEGYPYEVPRAICLFERSTGDPGWRHFERITTPISGQAVGVMRRELVFRSISQLGNYDYVIDYVFGDDGRLTVRVGSTGIVAVKGVDARTIGEAAASQEGRYGTLVSEHLVAPNHDHFFNFRIDLDVDGRSNSLVSARLQPEKPDSQRPQIWVVDYQARPTESRARIRMNPQTPTLFLFTNPNQLGRLGHAPSYRLVPHSISYSLLNPDELASIKNPYIQNQLWVTRHAQRERYPGGDYVFLGEGKDTLREWSQRDRDILNTDIVAWYTLGMHHVPRLEDWPVMPTHWSSFSLEPFHFFRENPTLPSRTK
ncbi:MAG: tyramine oxidase [Pseudomonadota bacterium]